MKRLICGEEKYFITNDGDNYWCIWERVENESVRPIFHSGHHSKEKAEKQIENLLKHG